MKNVTVFTIDKQVQAVEGDWLEVQPIQDVPTVTREKGLVMEEYSTCERWDLIEFNAEGYKFPHYDYNNSCYDTTYIAVDPELEHIVSVRFREQIQKLQQDVDFGDRMIQCLQQEIDHKDGIIKDLRKRYMYGLIGLFIGCTIGILWKLFM